MILKKLSLAIVALLCAASLGAQDFKLNSSGYFNKDGVDVMAFNDFYPEGHQGGISVLMNGHRIASNGDIRFDATPGQWQPVPKQLDRKIEGDKIITTLCFPDSSRHFTGFNPMIYPDYRVTYTVTLEPQGKGFLVTVDLDKPVPQELLGRAGFNIEFFPGDLFGKPWIMDNKQGIYPQQPNSPVIQQESYVYKSVGDFKPERALAADIDHLIDKASGYSPYTADEVIAEPYAVGKSFTSRPDDAYSRLTIKSLNGADLKLYDGRMNHTNGWFVVRSEIPAGATKGAVQWYIEPSVVPGWTYPAVVQTSQVGYLPNQSKVAIIETDRRDAPLVGATVVRYDADGEHFVKNYPAVPWEGEFLRYNYLKVDFTDIVEEGLYAVKYGDSKSPIFRIAPDVYDRGVWQPVIEYFLPYQMCHMRVADKYKVWHNYCHMDDAQMAPLGNHIDGYSLASNPTSIKAHEPVPGVNIGGWHDAGDDDVRHTTPAECYILTMAYENFHPEIDATAIDQEKHTVEIHEPDGKNDIQQQIEHGMLHVIACYDALGGHFSRGIITNTLRQYATLGDPSYATDGIFGNEDDRWIYPDGGNGVNIAAQVAASSRALRGLNDALADRCLEIAKKIYDEAEIPAAPAGARGGRMGGGPMSKMQLAVELYIATGEQKYWDFIISNWDAVVASASNCAWYMARIEKKMEGDKKYKKQCAAFREALLKYRDQLDRQSAATPYGVPYSPSIWGAGWDIQSFGYRHYFLAKEYPDIFAPDQVFDALNFILGRHPGLNQASFAGGVGAQSTTVGYGFNRADWTYVPGGTVSGTALIRPDFPELLVFPFLWQQVEYVMGGGSSHYMFLVLAAKDLLEN